MSLWLLVTLLAQVAPGDDQARLAADLDRKAADAALLGKYDEAERFQRRSLNLWEKVAGERAVNLAPVHVNLAQIYVAQHKLSDAEREARLAIALAAPEDLHRVTRLLGKIHFLAGDFTGAEHALRRSISGLEGDPSASRTERAAAMNDLGMALASKGDFREARRWMEKSEETYRVDGRTGADFGRALASLGLVCFRQGDYAAADRRYQEALSILNAALGRDHVHVGMASAEYAAVLRKLGRKSEAKAVDRRARLILASSTNLPAQHSVDVRSLR